jgi:hypothetical protein
MRKFINIYIQRQEFIFIINALFGFIKKKEREKKAGKEQNHSTIFSVFLCYSTSLYICIL